jgi:hypothetical protein
MQVFQTLALILFAVSANNEDKNLLRCGAYNLAGTLSTDLKKQPILFSQTPSGIPIQIELVLHGPVAFSAVNLRGKKVKISIKIQNQFGARNYRGTVNSITPDLPEGITPDSSKSVEFISAGKCSNLN